MDFSEAQREDFIEAFTDLFLHNGDPRDREELRDAGEKLIRECAEHFRRSITRCSQISGVISIS